MVPRRSDLVASGLLVVVLVAGFAVLDDLPAEMAIHFGAGGTPDNYVPRLVGVVLVPAIGFGTVAFTRLVGKADPTADPVVLDAAIYFVGGVLAYVHALVLWYNLGRRFSIGTALVPVFVATGLLVGWALYREGIGW